VRLQDDLFATEQRRERKQQAMAILQAATDAVEPVQAVHGLLKREGNTLSVAGRQYDLSSYSHVYVIGTGKATGRMALAVEEILGDTITNGVITVKPGFRTQTPHIRQIEAGHPVPTWEGVEGTRAMLQIADMARADDLVLCLISGGGSALLVDPAEGITLAEKQELTSLMLRAGCTINEMNAVRKHISSIKGGLLARRVAPATLLTLLVSDVIGNALDVIASGPTVPDGSSFTDALEVLRNRNLLDKAPPAVRHRLETGIRGEVPETPKVGDPAFHRTQNVIVASNEQACQAAVVTARRLGFAPLLLSTCVEGEAREVARVVVAIGKEMAKSGQPVRPPACLVMGGETTVTVYGDGLGGRNQELALAAAKAMEGDRRMMLAAYATDGNDGPTDASGGMVDGGTAARAHRAGISVDAALRRNDAYHCLDGAGDLLMTGPTGTNVNDVTILLVFA